MIKFNYLPVKSSDEKFKSFFSKHIADIEKFFPDFDIDEVSLSNIEVLVVEDNLCGVIILPGER